MSENRTTNVTELVMSRPSPFLVQFGLLLFLQVPSIACFLFILCNLLFVRRYRPPVHRVVNHVLLCSVVCDFLICTTELPVTLTYLFRGIVTPASDTFCLVWFFYAYAIFGVSLFLLTWNSVERYLLVFHGQLMREHLLIKHYLPYTAVCWLSNYVVCRCGIHI